MNINYFKNNLGIFAKSYSPESLFDKIRKVGRKAGLKTIYGVLILYYASLDKSLPIKDRLMVLAALGYFILPADLIPDALPGGFADDAAALFYVVKHIWSNLSDSTFAKARKRLLDWFPNADIADLSFR